MASEKELLQHFQFTNFRPGQLESILHLEKKNPVLSLMPTGAGKSLIYLWAAKVWNQKVLVISPLIALMQDQTEKARQVGLRADFVNSSLSAEERSKRYERWGRGDTQILFVTPERFRNAEFLDSIRKTPVDLLAVDEAHCISIWGHDFRPDYGKLHEIRKILNLPLTVAMTATATLDVQKDIIKNLGFTFNDVKIISQGLQRPNLHLTVHDLFGREEKNQKLIQLLRKSQESPDLAAGPLAKPNGATIVYFTLIQHLRETAQFLEKNKLQFLTYHGDLPSDVRKKNLKKFMQEESPLMLATPAFGLGIDRPDVRLLVHMDLPGSLEAYFQEVGRAGRDGKVSECHLLVDEESDIAVQMEFLKWSHPEKDFLQSLYRFLETNSEKLNHDGLDQVREHLNFKNRRDFRVESGVNILERWGCLVPSDQGFPWRPLRPPSEEDFKIESTPERFKNMNVKLLHFLRWVKNTEDCRMQKILEYFGCDSKPCGVCDVCR